MLDPGSYVVNISTMFILNLVLVHLCNVGRYRDFLGSIGTALGFLLLSLKNVLYGAHFEKKRGKECNGGGS